jgi:membrane-bound lytic murein transglycosylase D
MKNYKKHFTGNLFISLFLLFGTLDAFGQGPQVPREIQFADLTIRINEQARREIQLDVDALHRNQSYFQAKADRANLYMPFIERELREAGVPVDLKYLAIQESSLIPDAVSSSNAVGFWQFKQGTAEEVSLRVDNQVDERKNIVSSTRGAANYLKNHNAQFDNWMCAVVAYQMGLGGARAYFGSQFNGKKVIDLDRNSHWYFKKFLAHKIAFEDQVGASFVSNNGYLEEIKIQGPSNFKTVAARIGVSEEHLLEFNKWAFNGNIPGDKNYSVVYIKQGAAPPRPITAQRENGTPAPTTVPQIQQARNSFPNISGNTQNATKPDQILVNNIQGIRAEKTTSQENFAKEIGLKAGRFRRLNDMSKGDPIIAGHYYYLDKKAPKADVANHVVMPGETLWSISQKYGVRLAALKTKNRIRSDEDLAPGMVLNLQENRRRDENIVMVSGSEYRKMLEAMSETKDQEVVREATSTASRPVTPQPALTQAGTPSPETAQPQPTPVPSQVELAKVEESQKEEAVEVEVASPVRETSSAPTREETPAPPVRESSPAPTAAPTPAPVSQPEPTSRQVHVVAAGETLFRLSQNYGVSVENIRRWNNLSDNTIRVGQEVIVSEGPAPSTPAPSQPTSTPQPSVTQPTVAQPAVTQPSVTQPSAPPTQQSGTIIHVVAAGETLFRLSQNYSVSVDDIKKWNNLPDNTIQVGQRITIYKP